MAVSDKDGQGGKPRSNEPPASGEQNPAGAEPSDSGAGTPDDSRGGGNDSERTDNLSKKVEISSAEPQQLSEPTEAQKAAGNYKSVKTILYDNQGNPIDENGNLIIEDVKSIADITDADFTEPTRTVGLPTLPEIVQQVLSSNGKRVIIKKNIFGRNALRHNELTPEMSRAILNEALYNPTLYGKNKPLSRPNSWIVINVPDGKGNNKLVVLEVNDKKDNVEIVHWHEADERGLEKIKRQAEREDGQLLILPSETSEEAGALSGPTFDSPSDGKGNTLSGEKQEYVAKSAENEAQEAGGCRLASERGAESYPERARARLKGRHCGKSSAVAAVELEPPAIQGQHPVADAGAEYAYAGTHNHVIEPMTIIVQAAECYAGGHTISADSISGVILQAHEFGAHKCRGGMSRRHRAASTAIGARLLDGIFEHIDHDAHGGIGGSTCHEARHYAVAAIDAASSHSQICRYGQILQVVIGMKVVVATDVGHSITHSLIDRVKPMAYRSGGADSDHHARHDKLLRRKGSARSTTQPLSRRHAVCGDGDRCYATAVTRHTISRYNDSSGPTGAQQNK